MAVAPAGETVRNAYRADGRLACRDGRPRMIPSHYSDDGPEVDAWYRGWDAAAEAGEAPTCRGPSRAVVASPVSDSVDAIAVVERVLSSRVGAPGLVAVEVVVALVTAGLLPPSEIF